MKNYTSSVAPERSITNIESLLVKAKAADINKSYESGIVTAISFVIFEPSNNSRIAIRLPANVPQVFEALKKIMAPKRGSWDRMRLQRLQEQAARTAWKLMQDWLEVQLSLIEMKQAELLQIFLPYVLAGNNQTFYQKLKENNFIGLPAPESKATEN
jgi:hypothetical protein